MGGKPRPNPSIVSGMTVAFVEGGRKYYVDAEAQRYYSWDSLHGEFEVFDRRCFHLGSVYFLPEL
ncbi:colicin E3/pyocin S6 family cytotoxin [Pseudomonas syringae pv. coryli]|nr:colicin E3/pyocin S6 family cytotoxin [Pseudomonas syringae pv. coryli]SFJ07382.1 Cytotoxic [Pseudomonas syringae]